MSRALIPLANGFEELEAITIVDVLRRGGIEVVLASIHDQLEVSGAHGVMVTADAFLDEVSHEAFDAVILPGGSGGMENLRDSEAVLERLRRQKQEGGLMAAICAAPLVLVAAGVLEEDQEITCYPTLQMELDRPWNPQPVVHHGDVVTAQGPGTSLVFSQVLLQLLTGDQTCNRVSRAMLAESC